MHNKNILLVISGGIAAYKSLELIRLIKKSGGFVRCILTSGGAQFITPLSIEALSEEKCYTNMWEPNSAGIDHINLSRKADIIMVTPASANMIAKIAHGLADDLASTALLAANKPIIVAPAMNPEMWNNPATQANIKTLQERNITVLPPAEGDMACGETGQGRMPEATELHEALNSFFLTNKPLAGKAAIVTAGPTFEPIDPVRFIGNRSSGKQGYAIAAALHQAGADVTLISGPCNLPTPHGVTITRVETAQDMLKASLNALPADIAICTAAVSDWAPSAPADQKIKKQDNNAPPSIALSENPDILHTIANLPRCSSEGTKAGRNRPALVIGFAAETNNLEGNAKKKIQSKNCDWIIANDVSGEKVFGQDTNQVHLFTRTTHEEWPRASKTEIAEQIVAKIIKDTAP